MLFRPASLALALTVTLAGCADGVAPPTAPTPAPAGPTSARITNETDVGRFDVAFTIPAGTCGLSTTVTGTGVYQVVSRVAQTAAGDWRVGVTESASGTASGADASKYRFNYVASYKVLDVVSPGALPAKLDLVDHFNLIGQGGAPDIRVYLHGEFLFTGSLPVIPIGTPVIRGDVACDPL